MLKKVDTKRVSEWLDKHWTESKDCPICGKNKWGISGNVGKISCLRDKASGNNPVFPVVFLLCNNCGYVFMFNGLTSGLVDVEKQDEQRAGTKQKSN